MMRPTLALFLFLPFLLLSTVQADEHQFIGKVMKVTDGDTVVISSEREVFVKCRLYGIDAPETAKRGVPGQPYGEEATKELKHIILAKNVQVDTTTRDRYNRDICFVTLDGLDVNLEMVRRGYAWAFLKYLRPPFIQKYVAAETEARKNGLGLWHIINPEPPWEYRKKMKVPNHSQE